MNAFPTVIAILCLFNVFFCISGQTELRWCCKSHPEWIKCLTLQENIGKDLVDSDKPYSEFTCVQAENTEACANKLRKSEVDAFTIDTGDIIKYSKEGIIKLAFAENYGEGFGVSYYAVAVVKKSNRDISFKNLKGKKSCHTGIGKTAGWVAPIGKLIEIGEINPDVKCDVPKAVSEFFAGSCAPAADSEAYNPSLSGAMKLCSLCHGDTQGNNKCVRSHKEYYYGYSGAFRCLVEDAGDVAFVRHTTVKENTDAMNAENWAVSLRSEDYELICVNGTRGKLDQYESCHIAINPAHAVAIRLSMNEENMTQAIRLLNETQKLYGVSSQGFQMFKSSPFAGKDLLFEDNTVQLDPITTDYKEYLGSDYINAVSALECLEPLRWCTKSPQELAKCNDMSAAFTQQGWKPSVNCVKSTGTSECMDLFKAGDADIMMLDGGDAYNAGKTLNMIPVAIEQAAFASDAKYYAVAVVKKSSSLKWPNLSGVKSCHTGMNKTSGWIMPVGSLVESGVISLGTKCDAAKSMGDFFSSSCAPGGNTESYNPMMSNSDRLCQQCIGDEAGNNKCSRSQVERYYGYAGAFRCLVEGAGDIAFIKDSTVTEYTDGNGSDAWNADLKSSDFKLLCLDGQTSEISEFINCNLAKVPGHLLMITSKWKNQTQQIYQLLDNAQKIFKNPENSTIFSIFSSEKYHGTNLLFKDGLESLMKLDKDATYVDALDETYLKAIQAFGCENCGFAKSLSLCLWMLLLLSTFVLIP